GDANLDGRIDADDYFAIDSSLGKPAAAVNYSSGDFNYDGTIDGDDYFLIDANFRAQGAPISTATFTDFSTAAAPVPETAPAAIWLAAGSLLLFKRRPINRAKR